MEIGSRVSVAGVYGVCLLCYIGHDKLGRIYHTYLATIIQLYMMNFKQFVVRTYLTSDIEF